MILGFIKLLSRLLGAFAALMMVRTAFAEEPDMNAYLLRSEKFLLAHYSGKEYDIHGRFTHDLPFCQETISGGPMKPKSMCVAAIVELIVEAFRLHYEDHHNADIYDFLGKSSWALGHPYDIRSHIWVDPELHSSGTGDALTAFGIGKRVKFSELRAGDFVNLNRSPFPPYLTKSSGHAVLFLSYVDGVGNDLVSADRAAGFRYFSSQPSTHGFGERIAFFLRNNNKEWFCPKSANAPTDCGVLYSQNQSILNMGRLLDPSDWKPEIKNHYVDSIKQNLYKAAKVKGIGPKMSQAQFYKELDALPDTAAVAPEYLTTDF